MLLGFKYAANTRKCADSSAGACAGLGRQSWRGSPFGDVGQIQGLAEATVELEKIYQQVTFLRAEARLKTGGAEEALPELRARLLQNPFNEAVWHQLMRALCICGREAEALAAYSNARDTFVKELGVGPGTDLTRLNQLILNGMFHVSDM